MKEDEIKGLLQKYHAGKCTADEIAFLESWYAQWNQEIPFGLSSEELKSELSAISESIPTLRRAKEKQLWPRIAAAASILLFLSIGGYFLLHKQPQQQIAQNQVHDIAPGGNKTILTLANGKKIILNNAHNGLLAEQGGSVVNKTADGQLVYSKSETESRTYGTETQYNSITIPKGGEYQLVILPDGSKVWVNSASSLRYPTAFTGNERKVELTGEAYFEVAHNPAKPFRVVSNSQTVEVLGTHFNINGYDDEPAIKTTLLEGKVKVTATSNNIVKTLLPGQQAALNANSFTVIPVETEEAVAWKNGQFMFNNDNITYIMRTISRWYDVEVDYKGAVPGEGFYGGVSRFKNVSEVINTLQLTGKVHFKIEGRKITVSK